MSGLDPRQGLERAAQRRQRIFQLVRDIGGEAFDRVETVVERLRHFAQGARQMADLVRARGEIGNLLSGPDATPDALCRFREPAHRFGDRVGERQRQHQHHGCEHREKAQDAPAFPRQ